MQKIMLLGFIGWMAFAPSYVSADVRTEIKNAALRYFIENSHARTGLVRDRASNFSVTDPSNNIASMASTGFGLAAIAHAGAHGVLNIDWARNYVLNTLKFSRDHVPRRKGWFLHFVDWETGGRAWDCEYSTIDTALFLAGALYAAQVLNSQEIYDLAHQLYADVDFIDAMTDGGSKPGKRTLNMGFIEEHGYIPWQWDMYGEQKILLILGLAHPTNPLPPEAWHAWRREGMGEGEALFVHQYSEVFLDFRNFHDGFFNYFENGREMTRRHRELSIDGFWGFSAGDSPNGYRVWSLKNNQSTVCIGCAVASSMFDPQTIDSDLQRWFDGPLKEKIWGRYGFTDSIDLAQNWFGPDVLGITVGPAYLSVVNGREATSIWKDFMRIPEIARVMREKINPKPFAAAF